MDNCKKCGAKMVDGIALENTSVRGVGDFIGDKNAKICTMYHGGPGKVIDCVKCPECGHSVHKSMSEE